VTTLKVVPRGTEGAISIEGTIAGILASVFLAGAGYLLGQVHFFCLKFSTIRNILGPVFSIPVFLQYDSKSRNCNFYMEATVTGEFYTSYLDFKIGFPLFVGRVRI
jgi:hypothetical protein